MSARDDVSEIFDAAAWQPADGVDLHARTSHRATGAGSAACAPAAGRPVGGFDLHDLTYHRAVDAGVVRIAFDRPEVRNAFRPPPAERLLAGLAPARGRSR